MTASIERCGYTVHRWPNQRIIVITDVGPLYLDPDLFDRLDDTTFEQFMTAWLAGDYAGTCVALGLPDPRDGLKHLAEANERERARIKENGSATEPVPAEDPQYEMHKWAVEWPILFGGQTERETYATEAEAREILPAYGPTAYVVKIEPVRVEI